MLRKLSVFFALIISVTVLSSPALVADTVIGPKPQPGDEAWLYNPPGIQVETWVSGLKAPWSLAFLPDGRALVSERSGNIKLIERGGRLRRQPIAKIAILNDDESGLMGLAVDPRFPNPPFVYAMYTWRRGERRGNQVFRFRLNGTKAKYDRVILGGIPAGDNHNGGRIAFGPDNMLYVTTGDIFERHLAQRRDNLAGKILRVTPDGDIPSDNPFPKSPIWSYGHRNPQGLAWDPGTGTMYSSEHGPSGEVGFGAYDEINRIVKGGNYGWPLAVGAPGRRAWQDPIATWPENTTPPSGMAVWHGDIYVATLGSDALVRLRMKGERVIAVERWFHDGDRTKFGRLRDAVVGPDGALYVLTGNKDWRGSVERPGDDRILRITRN